MKKVNLKFKIAIPEGATLYAENGDKTINLLLYEVEQLERLQEVKANKKTSKYLVKDGQFVKKGEPIFSEGFLGHKTVNADFNGIIEIREDSFRILGQKRYFERRINLQGTIDRILPQKCIKLSCLVSPLDNIYYYNEKNKLSDQIYLHDKKDISADHLKSIAQDVTIFVNDNLYVEDIAKLIALGVKRLVVNGVFVDNIENLRREVRKLKGFCVLGGFGEFVSRKIHPINPKMNIYWGKKKLYFSDNVVSGDGAVYEHPFWGLSGKWHRKNELIGELEYNNELFEFYLKNLDSNA
jgi:hypothetical protein